MTIPVEDCYGWMFQMEAEEDNLDLLLDLRRGVEDLSETAGSFRLKDVADFHPTRLHEEYIWLVGSWEMPERLSTSRVTRYVNPQYVHKRNYADIVVKCECGALVGRERNVGGFAEEHNHTDLCTVTHREKARERLREERQEWIKTAAHLYMSYAEAAPRMGMDRRNLGFMCERYGIDWQTRRKQGRERAILTWRKLHDEYGHKWRKIAEAFDANPATVRSYARGHGRNIDV